MAERRWGPAVGLSHGCLVHPRLKPDNSLPPPDDARKDGRGIPSRNKGVCGVEWRGACATFSQVLRERLKVHLQRYSDPMKKTARGGYMSHRGSRCGKGSRKCCFCRQSNSCRKHCSVLRVDGGPAATSSTHPFRYGYCYDMTKSIISPTTNLQCPTTRAIDSTFITQRRLRRQNSKLIGQHLVPKAAGGGNSFEVRTVLVVVAMVVGSCYALPTLPPHAPPPSSRTPQLGHEPPRKEVTACCSEKVVGIQSTNVTVLRTSPTSVLVTWTRPTITPIKYEITYKPTNAKYRVVAEVKAPLKSVVLERLLPLTQYQVFVTTIISNTTVWTSPVVTFLTAIEDVNAPGNGTLRIFSTPTIVEGVEASLDEIRSSVSADKKMRHVRVRAEEVGIVVLVLGVWMFAIVLFFNRWGKIRMLEPYQEPYKEAPPQPVHHRSSCQMADPCALPISSLKRPSLTPSQLEYHLGYRRTRQNSVFVGRTRSYSLDVHPPRRVKSALNLTTLVLQESEEEGAVATTYA